MKKWTEKFLLGSLLLCLSCFAVATESTGHDPEKDKAEHRWYVSGTLGQARGEVGAREMNVRMAELGYNAEARVSGQNRTAWRLATGYQWTDYISTELGYTDLGEVRTRLSGSVADMEAYLNSANQVHPRTSDGIEVALLAAFPLREDLRIFGKAGLMFGDAYYRARSTSRSASRSDRESIPLLGVGLGYDLNERWSIRGEWNRYQVDDEDIDFWGASLIYRFDVWRMHDRGED